MTAQHSIVPKLARVGVVAGAPLFPLRKLVLNDFLTLKRKVISFVEGVILFESMRLAGKLFTLKDNLLIVFFKAMKRTRSILTLASVWSKQRR